MNRSLMLLALFALPLACSQDPDPEQDMHVVTRDMMFQDLSDAHDMFTPDISSSDMGTSDTSGDLTVLSDLPADMADMADMSQRDADQDMEVDGGADMMRSGMALAGFGALTGDCQQIDDELFDPGPSSFRNVLDFSMDPYGTEDLMALTPGGQAIIAAGNAGGNSVLSEVFAFEVLARCESATLLETETTIDYVNTMGKITDLLVEIDGERVGVSVVRAIAFPFEEPYPESEARRVLEKKLGDIKLSTQNVQPNHAWVKQILSVIAYTPQHAAEIEAVYLTLDPSIKGDTIVYITTTEGSDRPLYFND